MTEKNELTQAIADEAEQRAADDQRIASLTARVTAAECTINSVGSSITILADSLRVSGPPVIQAVVIDPRVLQDGLPATQTVESAGFDLRAYPDYNEAAPGGADFVVIPPGKQLMVSTGLRVWINKPGYAGFMFARSGSGSKGLVLGNGTGVIDSDYQGPLKMCLWNRSDKPITVNAGDRVAQLVIMPVLTGYEFKVVGDFESETARGQNGFGSTGAK